MKPSPSPLNIIDCAIMNFELNFVAPEEVEDFDVQGSFKDYPLDIDFDISSNDFFQVFIKADINRSSERRPGYSIFAEAACIFKFDEHKQLNSEQRNSLKDFSTIYIALNSLRGLISNFTANAPFGRYILPSIDLNDLITKKKAELTEANQERLENRRAQNIKNSSTKKIKASRKK